jgi:hypothetical protein
MKDRFDERVEMLSAGGNDDQRFFDLSKGGVCCNHPKKLEKGTIVNVMVNDVYCKARIAYCMERRDGYRLGMQFVDVSAEKQKSLDGLADKFSRGVPVTCRVIDDTPSRG